MDDISDELLSEQFKMVSHPLRIKIIKILAQGDTSYTTVLHRLGVSTGVLNFHLSKLRTVVEKDGDIYKLSDLGKTLFKVLESYGGEYAVQPKMSLQGEEIGIDMLLTTSAYMLPLTTFLIFFISVLVQLISTVVFQQTQMLSFTQTVLLLAFEVLAWMVAWQKFWEAEQPLGTAGWMMLSMTIPWVVVQYILFIIPLNDLLVAFAGLLSPNFKIPAPTIENIYDATGAVTRFLFASVIALYVMYQRYGTFPEVRKSSPIRVNSWPYAYYLILIPVTFVVNYAVDGIVTYIMGQPRFTFRGQWQGLLYPYSIGFFIGLGSTIVMIWVLGNRFAWRYSILRAEFQILFLAPYFIELVVLELQAIQAAIIGLKYLTALLVQAMLVYRHNRFEPVSHHWAAAQVLAGLLILVLCGIGNDRNILLLPMLVFLAPFSISLGLLARYVRRRPLTYALAALAAMQARTSTLEVSLAQYNLFAGVVFLATFAAAYLLEEGRSYVLKLLGMSLLLLSSVEVLVGTGYGAIVSLFSIYFFRAITEQNAIETYVNIPEEPEP